MIRLITRDTLFLSRKAAPATREDLPLAADLLDSLKANRDRYVGMAANMIGVAKAAIVVNMGPFDVVMFNPVITKKSGPYEAKEGCLSLTGVRKTTRYEKITVEYMDASWAKRRSDLSGWTAEIVQHEVDHLMGILI